MIWFFLSIFRLVCAFGRIHSTPTPNLHFDFSAVFFFYLWTCKLAMQLPSATQTNERKMSWKSRVSCERMKVHFHRHSWPAGSACGHHSFQYLRSIISFSLEPIRWADLSRHSPRDTSKSNWMREKLSNKSLARANEKIPERRIYAQMLRKLSTQRKAKQSTFDETLCDSK